MSTTADDNGPAALYSALKQYSGEVRKDRRLTVPPADSVTVHSPLCGSQLTLDARLAGDRVAEIGYRVRACSLGQATTAIVARRAPGMDASELERIGAQLHAILNGKSTHSDWPELDVFSHITEATSRHGSAELPFRALQQIFHRAGIAGGPHDTDVDVGPSGPGGNDSWQPRTSSS